MNNKTVIVIIEGQKISVRSTFKKLCFQQGWKYQTLANKKLVPKIGNPIKIDGKEIHRLNIE